MKASTILALLCSSALFSSCAQHPQLTTTPSFVARAKAAHPEPVADDARTTHPAENVIVITLDGVRWQEIFDGCDPSRAPSLPPEEAQNARELTPNLHRLFFDEGTVLGNPHLGAGFFASGAHHVSLPGYQELMTGDAPTCVANDCTPDVAWTLADEVASRTDGGPDAVAVFSSWERIAATASHADQGRVLVRAGRPEGGEEKPFPGMGDYLPDRYTAERALDHLASAKPRFLWVGLGDTDEWAHMNDYRSYLKALRFADGFVGQLAARLAQMGDYGAHTAVFVTADHGRDAGFADHGGPASAGIWLMARGGPIPASGEVALREPHYLREVAPTVVAVLGHPGSGPVLAELLERRHSAPHTPPSQVASPSAPARSPGGGFAAPVRAAPFFAAP